MRFLNNFTFQATRSNSFTLIQPSSLSIVNFFWALIVVSLFLKINCLLFELIISQKMINPSFKGLFKSLSKTTKLLLFLFINVIFGYIKISEHLYSVSNLYSLCQVKLLSSIQVLFSSLYFLNLNIY